MSGIEQLQSDRAQILYILGLGLKNVLDENFINIPKFHEKPLSCSGDIKIFCSWRKMYIYTLPHL